jgi:CRISPR-associated protein Cmr5
MSEETMGKQMNLIKKVEHGRAKFAYLRVKNVAEDENKSWRSDYKSYLKKLPMLIKTNGIAATFSFILTKDSSAYSQIYEDCSEWIKNDPKEIFNFNSNSLLEYVLNLDSAKYRAFTTEILSFINWMRRFADGMIDQV